jgi:preprotein translocase subunit SecA
MLIAEAGSKGAVTIATNMAGRGTDIKLGGSPEHRARKRAGTEADPEQYAEILAEEYKKWRLDYEEVKSLGGLYVIGTERHESRRIDNQLRGRSGRQGDPGRSKFFISMDDDLMRLFGGENIKGLMAKIGMEEGEPIYHPWLNKSIERAQKKVEERNFEIRKHLLEYDDVLNQQRKFIYEQRDLILADSNLKPRIHDATADMVEGALASYRQAQKQSQAEALLELSNYLKTQFGHILHVEDEGKEAGLPKEAMLPEKLQERIIADLERDIEEKEALVGEANLNNFIRMQYLQSIDRKWLDHLENMEGLRESVYLRSYAQKNPLTEYKLEGAQIFSTMIDTIRAEIASRLHLVRIQAADNREVRSHTATAQSATHGSVGAFAGSGGNAGRSSRGAGQEAVTVVRAVPKVGRNDPCPCGSGKKYKFCHGR